MDKAPLNRWATLMLKGAGIVVALVSLHLILRKPLGFLIVYITARLGCC